MEFPLGVARQLNPGLGFFILKDFPGFNYIGIAVKSRNFVFKPRTNFKLKFVRGLSAIVVFEGNANQVSSQLKICINQLPVLCFDRLTQTRISHLLPHFICRAVRD